MDQSASAGNCPVTSSTAAFALMTDDGHVYKFDAVGNTRAADEMKNNKKWASAGGAAAKPFRVRVNGMLQGDTIMVESIH